MPVVRVNAFSSSVTVRHFNFALQVPPCLLRTNFGFPTLGTTVLTTAMDQYLSIHRLWRSAIKGTMIAELNSVVTAIVQTTLTSEGDCGFETHSLSRGESCDEGYVNAFNSGVASTMYMCPRVVGTSANSSPVDRRSGGDETTEVVGRSGEPAKELKSRTETSGTKSEVRRRTRRFRTAVSGCIHNELVCSH